MVFELCLCLIASIFHQLSYLGLVFDAQVLESGSGAGGSPSLTLILVGHLLLILHLSASCSSRHGLRRGFLGLGVLPQGGLLKRLGPHPLDERRRLLSLVVL